MRNFIYTVLLFSNMLYFSIASIIGFDVENEGARVYFKIYCIICFVVFGFFHLSYYSRKNHTITRSHVISYIILFFYILCGIVAGYTQDPIFLSLVAYGIPAIGISVYFAENKNLNQIVKWLDVILLVVSFSLFFSVKHLLLQIADGTKYYSQSLSYYAAFCFVLCLFLLLFGNMYERFHFFSRKGYKYFCILLLFYLLAMMFISGGRGALGTLIIGITLVLYYYYKFNKKIISIILKFSIISVIVISCVIHFMPIGESDVFIRNFGRVFSFFNSDMSISDRTSGRDVAFSVAFSEISEHPILGSGIFGYKDSFTQRTGLGWPHNFFVEILLQGGVVFFIVVLAVLLRGIKKTTIILKNPSDLAFLIFIVYPMSMLLFSGSYVAETLFWFSFGYVYNYHFPKHVS